MSEDLTPDWEPLVSKKLSELREIAAEHQQRNPEESIGFDPGSDPVTREAVFRLIEENMDETLAKHGDTLDPKEIARVKREFREEVEKHRESGQS